MENILNQIFSQSKTSPFLFLGSGFSRRYIGLDTWEALLRNFSKELKMTYEYYSSKHDGALDYVASSMSEEFFDYFFNLEKYDSLRTQYSQELQSPDSPFKVFLSEYLKNESHISEENFLYQNELELLRSINIDGIITTNWDCFIEKIYPDYKVFIGQRELLFSNPLEIGEIYKIHGCITKPNSLIVTNKDYSDYNDRNPYLAAKLITIFVEHPIVFMGYSLNDKNIVTLLKSIVDCLEEEHIRKLGKNIIFINWNSDPHCSISISHTFIPLDRMSLPITLVNTHSFIPIYEALSVVKRKIPIKILRYCKDQLYELIKTNDPKDQIFVSDIDNLTNEEEPEFVIGIGIQSQYGKIGYDIITKKEVCRDIVFEELKYDAEEILEFTIPILLQRTHLVPFNCYLNQLGYTSINSLQSNETLWEKLKKGVSQNKSTFINNVYNSQTIKEEINRFSFTEFLEKYDADKIVEYAALHDDIDIDELQGYLKENFQLYIEEKINISHFRKLICLYDFLRYPIN